jgi:hypothetical protein
MPLAFANFISMRMKKKIKKRLTTVNAFLHSKKKPGLKSIHVLRLEVKHLEAYLELMVLQDNIRARPEVPKRLEKLFHEAGEVRKYELESEAIRSIIKNSDLFKPSRFLDQLVISEKRSNKKLRRKRKSCSAFKLKDFAKYPNSKLSANTYKRLLATRATSILNLLKKEILSDIASLHQLRKILKSVLYVLPLCKKKVSKPVRILLKTHNTFMKSVESKIGAVHDKDFFVRSLNKKQEITDAGELVVLKKIKRIWQKDLRNMKKEIKNLLPVLQQFALDLREQTTGDLLVAVRKVK